MAVLSIQKASTTGLAPAYGAAAAGGDEFDNSGRTYAHVKNGGAAEITVTVDSPVKCNQGFTHNLAVAVPAGQERIIGPFEPNRFNGSNGRAKVTYSAVTSVTVAAIEV